MDSQAVGRLRRFSWLTILAAGMMFGASCGFAELEAISAGLTAAGNSLDNRNNNNVSFTDWLANELDNL